MFIVDVLAHCYDKIVDLALCAAEKADPQQLALAAYKTPDAATSDSLPSRLLSSRYYCLFTLALMIILLLIIVVILFIVVD